MYPSNWGTKDYPDPLPEFTQENFPTGFSHADRRNIKHQGEGSNQPILSSVRSQVADHSMLLPPDRMSYNEWKQTKGNRIWISENRRKSKRIVDDFRRFVRQTVRAANDLFITGMTTGEWIGVAIELDYVVIDVHPDGDSDLKGELLTFLKSVLGDDPNNAELNHFYKMILHSTQRNFWMIEYHPILMSIGERYHLPSDTRQGLLLSDPKWETDFDEFVGANFSVEDANIDIRSEVYTHRPFLEVYDNNDNTDEEKGFRNTSVGLNRFARVLVMHGADRKLQPISVEKELSYRFPSMLIHLFQFLFQITDLSLLGFLARRASIEDGNI